MQCLELTLLWGANNLSPVILTCLILCKSGHNWIHMDINVHRPCSANIIFWEFDAESALSRSEHEPSKPSKPKPIETRHQGIFHLLRKLAHPLGLGQEHLRRPYGCMYGRCSCMCMFVWKFVCMFVCSYLCIYACIYVSMYMSIYLSKYASIYRSVYHISIDLFIYVCIYVCIHVSIFLCIYITISVSIYVSMHLLSMYLHIYPSVYLSIYLCFYLSMYLCIYASMHVCMHCMDVYMYVRTETPKKIEVKTHMKKGKLYKVVFYMGR